MDYEKKYNDLVNDLKEFWNCHTNDSQLLGELAEIFPELRESEDERIRKGLIEVVSDIAGGWPFEEHRITKKEALAYLEKQKENPKSAISIPADCTSDAKCENSWHKVADSLPDNPREVLCKDEAGNFFIGRYYVGEGWEISNYDDEDKPHHLNPPVAKWIDFPSEKQKEQKPLSPDEKMNHPLYLEGFDVGREVGKVEAEQKPAEWSEEDENMFNDILLDMGDRREMFKSKGETTFAENTQKKIDWLDSHHLQLKYQSSCPQPKVEWSEEDEDKLEQCIRIVSGWERDYDIVKSPYSNFLKSLRPHWKPSEEQMEHLQRAINYYESDWGENKLLRSLINDLKKRM